MAWSIMNPVEMTSTFETLAAIRKTPTRQVLPENVRVFDASTPVPDCFAWAMIMAAWSSHALANSAISTDIAMSGTAFEYAGEWELPMPTAENLQPWFEFYSNIGFIRADRLIPFAPFALIPKAAETVVTERHVRVRTTQRLLGLPEKSVSIVNFGPIADMTLGSVAKRIPFGKTLGRFPCPGCSISAPVYHAVRNTAGRFTITRPGSQTPTVSLKCKGARAWAEKVTSETAIRDLIRSTGLVLNGMAAYAAIHETIPEDHGLLMRDYSNDRGVAEFGHKLWGDRLFVSTRLTVRNEDGQDLGWRELLSMLERNPAPFRQIIDQPLISDGRAIFVKV